MIGNIALIAAIALMILTVRQNRRMAKEWKRSADLWAQAAQNWEKAAAAWQRAADIRNTRGGS